MIDRNARLLLHTPTLIPTPCGASTSPHLRLKPTDGPCSSRDKGGYVHKARLLRSSVWALARLSAQGSSRLPCFPCLLSHHNSPVSVALARLLACRSTSLLGHSRRSLLHPLVSSPALTAAQTLRSSRAVSLPACFLLQPWHHKTGRQSPATSSSSTLRR